ncbi:MAG: 2-amino-4-hydroxy-6-hydroxymethyldihydropteridine diphosphokinase [Haliscomenobacter sp.]|nr:2-amino-4-hydroxy-6-hydroxymethyldihydropteridine diphosphokinase [Haliscomenobacter sp.]MBK7477448.1 2-amino-4-hydroxy-6-hydroxymethyldihydropteridine diphosphokinase [Haliscomenobacter sp.]MBK8877436.1 2-amino-4-hydroxy-6-hydroxymethyldihydropteridine diphosphokinase [Haliscomenobacter sp.]
MPPLTSRHLVYLGLGTNLGDRLNNLERARILIQERIGPVRIQSSVYQTEPWGLKDQPEFYNQVLLLETGLAPPEVILDVILHIEKEMGRIRHLKWDRRLIDIDILFFDREVLQLDRLTIPHPLMEKRNFVLAPLAEIAPDFLHPVLEKTIRELAQTSTDLLKAEILAS